VLVGNEDGEPLTLLLGEEMSTSADVDALSVGVPDNSGYMPHSLDRVGIRQLVVRTP
jgi:hypothetical protein